MAQVGSEARHGGVIVPKYGMQCELDTRIASECRRAAEAVVGAGNSGIPAAHRVAVGHGIANVVLADAGLRRRRALDFNPFSVRIGAGLDPFSQLGEDEQARFDASARRLVST